MKGIVSLIFFSDDLVLRCLVGKELAAEPRTWTDKTLLRGLAVKTNKQTKSQGWDFWEVLLHRFCLIIVSFWFVHFSYSLEGDTSIFLQRYLSDLSQLLIQTLENMPAVSPMEFFSLTTSISWSSPTSTAINSYHQTSGILYVTWQYFNLYHDSMISDIIQTAD